MYDNEFEMQENKIKSQDKIQTQNGRIESPYCGKPCNLLFSHEMLNPSLVKSVPLIFRHYNHCYGPVNAIIMTINSYKSKSLNTG